MYCHILLHCKDQWKRSKVSCKKLCSYLNGVHLSVTSPAEVRKLQGVVAKSHRPAVQHGPLLNLKLQVVKVWEVMILTRSIETQRSI